MFDASDRVRVEISDVTFDGEDPERLARFWSELVGRPVPYVGLERTGGAPGIGFQRVAGAKEVKNRLHLDDTGRTDYLSKAPRKS
ncbi:MAG TPA: VOC family protein [Acidimicrobiales bacterium]|nr:VOC family protein [Acidimicrobiales bacterium]